MKKNADSSRTCTLCNAVIPSVDYQMHLNGKKHKAKEAAIANKKKLEETGLFIRGVPKNAVANDVMRVFSPYGTITSLEIHPNATFLQYSLKESRENALTERHYMNNRLLSVKRRIIQPRQEPPPARHKSDCVLQKPVIDHEKLMEELSEPSDLSSQLDIFFKGVLAGESYCEMMKDMLMSDIKEALLQGFSSVQTHAFGSMITGLAFKDSDLDVYACVEDGEEGQTKSLSSCHKGENKLDVLKKAVKCFYRRSAPFSNVVPIKTAKTPIIKLLHDPTQVSCDLTFQNMLGCCNSRLLHFYLSLHERFYSLMVVVKYWARVHELSGPSKFSNYALGMLVINFLQATLDGAGNRILPTVQQLQQHASMEGPLDVISGWHCSFTDDPFTIALPDSSSFSLLGLLKGFFEYAATFPYHTHVVCPLVGDMVSRDLFQEHPEELSDAFQRYKKCLEENPDEGLCKVTHDIVIQDPFKLTHNLTARVQSSAKLSFIHACQCAAKTCAKALEDDEAEMRVMHDLLTPLDLDALMGKRGDKMSIFINHPSPVQPSLYDKEYTILTEIFTRVLCLTVTEEEKEDPRKIQKMQDMIDVHNEGEKKSLERIFQCEGDKPLWVGRGKAKKGLHLSGGLSLENEELVSLALLKKSAESQPVKFRCKVHFQNDEGKLEIQFEDLTSSKNKFFNSLHGFFTHHLPKWVHEFVKQALSVDRQSEVCENNLNAPEAELELEPNNL